jgi:glutathione S-transferase
MIKVWGRRSASNVQKVLWCIDELGVPYEHIHIPFGRAKEDPDYLRINPNGRVPAIEEDGFVLWESNTCVRYIAARFGAGTLWPTEPRQRADAERWMDWQLATLSGPTDTIFIGLVLRKPEERDMGAIDAAVKRLNHLWAMVDRVLAARPFIAGDALTIGDIPIGLAAHRWLTIPVERDRHAHVEAWYRRLTERAPFRTNVIEAPR